MCVQSGRATWEDHYPNQELHFNRLRSGRLQLVSTELNRPNGRHGPLSRREIPSRSQLGCAKEISMRFDVLPVGGGGQTRR
jgi:hypothetical protein